MTVIWISTAVCMALIAFFILIQAVPTIRMLRALRASNCQPLSDEDCPKAVVILSLRGPDPFLVQTLEALFRQDYPNYHVRIVIDHAQDPAWEAVNDVMQRLTPTNVQVQVLSQPHDTCSLKLSSVLQAVSQLDDSFAVVSLLDADVVPHSGWLRELVAPLVDPKVAVASGHRWFIPRVPALGSLVRYLWCTRVLVHTAISSVWGGSVSIKRQFLNESGLLQMWQHSISEDAPLNLFVSAAGYRIAFVPTVMAVSQESCTLRWVWPFLLRQFLVGWLYGPRPLLIPLFNLLVTFTFIASVVLAAWTAEMQNWGAFWMVVGGLLVYGAAALWQILAMERAVARVIRLRGKSIDWLSVMGCVKLLFAAPLYRLVDTAASVRASFQHECEWRGIHYRIQPHKKVQVVEYVPYRSDQQTVDGNASI